MRKLIYGYRVAVLYRNGYELDDIYNDGKREIHQYAKGRESVRNVYALREDDVLLRPIGRTHTERMSE